MREWAAIQQLFSLRRTCLNYPNEWSQSDFGFLGKAMGGKEPCTAILEMLR